MAPKYIAIIGSCDPARKNELDLKHIEQAETAGESIGRALAEKGYHIIVYASFEHNFEVPVVRGYATSDAAKPGSIRVLYSDQYPRPSFAEVESHRALFDFRPDSSDEWEISFYQSLVNVDGVILLGGGSSTLAAGLVAMGHRKPIIACAAFGGAARKVWAVLSAQGYPLDEKEQARMAQEDWLPDRTAELVDTLESQKKQFDQRQKESAAHSERAQDVLYSWAAATLFILAVACWVIAWGVSGISYGVLLVLLIAAPMCTGVVGAAMRPVIDRLPGMTQEGAAPRSERHLILGLIAGGISAILFILAQVFANPSDMDTSMKVEQIERLIPFAIVIGFVAGLTLERVFGTLSETEVVHTEQIDAGT